jgi:hypothetical protein
MAVTLVLRGGVVVVSRKGAWGIWRLDKKVLTSRW